jgi:hypothetical protein
MSHDNIDEIRESISTHDGTCYSNEFECQIVDNYIFKTQGGGTYELFLNAASGCCVNATNVGFTKRYGRTFKENDPIRQMADGYPPEHAAFQGKINGGDFIPNVCQDIEYFSDLNVEPINFYNYRLSSMQTEYVSLSSDTKQQSIHDRRNKTLGEVWCRNTLSTKIQPIDELIPSIKQFPDIYNNIIDFNVVYDTMLIYTDSQLYMDRLVYDYNTGEFNSAPVSPIVITQDSNKRSKLIKPFFNEAKEELVLGKTVVVNDEVTPELYKYSVDTGIITPVYANITHIADHNRYRIPYNITKDYRLNEVSDTHITYNEVLHKYTVTITGRLSARTSKLIDSAGIAQYNTKIFGVFIYNYKDTARGLKLLDSIAYIPSNTEEYSYDLGDQERDVILEGRGGVFNLTNVSDSKTKITINPRLVQTREHKLKEIRYTYRDKTQTVSRLPVNDMYYADIPDIMNMVESWRGHRCGGPTDFASPRYTPVVIDLDLNLDEVSSINVLVEAVYYDGHIETWQVTGEAKPLPLDAVLKGFKLIDTKSYTTNTNPNLLKLIFESEEPRHITEFIVNNNNSRETGQIRDFELLSADTDTLSSASLSSSPLSS